jgi:hypothetical protein
MTQNDAPKAITPKQARAIQALLTNPTLTKACGEAKISRSTLGRWLADPRFNRALIEAEGQALQDTTRLLLTGRDAALKTLGDLMTKATSDNVRRQAANDWLNFMYKSYELQTLETRISELERTVKK